MSKILRLFTVSLLLASIMITTVASGVFAHDRDREAIQSRAKSLSGMRLVHCIEPDFAGLFRFI